MCLIFVVSFGLVCVVSVSSCVNWFVVLILVWCLSSIFCRWGICCLLFGVVWVSILC